MVWSIAKRKTVDKQTLDRAHKMVTEVCCVDETGTGNWPSHAENCLSCVIYSLESCIEPDSPSADYCASIVLDSATNDILDEVYDGRTVIEPHICSAAHQNASIDPRLRAKVAQQSSIVDYLRTCENVSRRELLKSFPIGG